MGSTKARTSAKSSVPETRPLPDKTFIIDNGAYNLKAGYAPDNLPEDNNGDYDENALSACSTIPNTIAKTRGNRLYIGSQLNSQITDLNEMMFRRPVEKGYLVNWEVQKEIWEHSFFDEKTVRSKEMRIATPEETTLVLTEAPNALPVLQKNADEMVMEEWGFGGYVRCTGTRCEYLTLLCCGWSLLNFPGDIGPSLNAWNEVHSLFGDPIAQKPDSAISPAECLLVVDSGYSHTTVTPVYKGQPLQRAIRRLDLGGKHLTNYLKEMVSMRQYNMVEETYIMNEVKEAACFVSDDLSRDMERTWKGNRKRGEPDPGEGIVVDYVLPDPNAGKKGFMRPHDPLLNVKKKKGVLSSASAEALSEDALVLGNERFTVPEILFNPRDIGMRQAGIPDTILHSLSVLPTGLHPVFLANILVVGGNSLIPGFKERLYEASCPCF